MWWEDTVLVTVTTEFGIMDRLRILIGRPVTTRVMIDTENEVGRTRTKHRVTVPSFRTRNVMNPWRKG